jgi:uncharacterized protein YkwD
VGWGSTATRGTVPGMSLSPSRPRRAHNPALALALAVVLGLAGAVASPTPAAATTATPDTVAAELLRLTNADRAARDLRPLRRDTRLAAIARDRAGNLASASTFSHSAAGGSLSTTLDRAGIQWYAWGENLAWTPGGLRSTTAASVFTAWKQSTGHWAQLMSRTLNYVGFGVAVRASDGRVFATAIFTESRDHTRPSARIVDAARSGTSVTFTWRGYDAPLQTHWAGLRDFDVWYRVDDGAWRLIRDNTTATSIRLTSRAPGHRYWLMVRARDRVSNVGAASSPISVWVP